MEIEVLVLYSDKIYFWSKYRCLMFDDLILSPTQCTLLVLQSRNHLALSVISFLPASEFQTQ